MEANDPTPHEHGEVTIPDELAAEIEEAFSDVVTLPDDQLFLAIEGLHAFLDALTPQEMHDERMNALYAIRRPNDMKEAEAGLDAMRAWIKDTKDAICDRLDAIGQDRSAVWCYHATIAGFVQWGIDATDRSFAFAQNS